MSTADAQKSEVHAATADAESSPTSAGDAATTRRARPAGPIASPASLSPLNNVTTGPLQDLHIIDDQTDDGGPLVVESTDPELNPPHPPIDPFPTDGTPQSDPPINFQRTRDAS